MKRHTEYRASYFEHDCIVGDCADVLETDIRGNTLATKIRRWWFNWVLVSYDDERVKNYFTSSHALRMERTRHYRTYRNRIHPLSKFRIYRDIFMFLVFLVNILIFHHNTSIMFGQLSYHFYYVGALSDWIVLADVFINLHTGYIDENIGKIILDKDAGLLHYASSKLFVHVASAIPIQTMLFLRYGTNVDCDFCKINYFIVALKVLSIFGVIRLYECSSYLTWERSNYKLTHFFKFLRIYLMGLVIMVFYNDMCDTVTLMKMVADGKLDEAAYMTRLIYSKFVVPNPPSNYTFFIITFGRICKSVLLFSLSYRKSKYHLDIIASLFAFVITNLIYIWLITECYDFIYRRCFIDDRVLRMKQALESLGACRQLPDTVTKKLKSFFDFNPAKLRAIEQGNNLYMSLPESVKGESLLVRHIRYFKRIPYFVDWPQDVIEDVVSMLKEEIYLSGDLVAEPWVQSEGLLIVGMGELAVYNYEDESGHLIDGDYFGELSLVTDREKRTSRVVAITPCVMLLLEKDIFRIYMREYPELFFALKQELLGDMTDQRSKN